MRRVEIVGVYKTTSPRKIIVAKLIHLFVKGWPFFYSFVIMYPNIHKCKMHSSSHTSHNGIEVWGSTYKSNLNCIFLTQKMAVRAITFSNWQAHSRPLFQDLKILSIYDLHHLSVCTFMYDLKNKNVPHSLTDYCNVIQHRYSTRQKVDQQVHLPKFRTSQGQFSISFLGSMYWNDVPTVIKLQPSRNTFRNTLKSYLLNQ